MRIVVIEGSPHRDGSSNMLAREFIRGAEGEGHTVRVFDAAHSRICPCRGCDVCGMSGPCVQKDDMAAIREALLDSDMVVFVTPLYYFGMSAQIKAVIDRFYAFNGQLMSRHLKAALICAAWNSDDWTMRDVSSHYGTICRYLGFEDVGQILAVGCGTPGMTEHSPFLREAFELGSGLRERGHMCQTSGAGTSIL